MNRQAFEKALEENEDDNFTRQVYADWLEENGEDDEANRQRSWKAAKEWMVDFASKCGFNQPNYPDEDEVKEITYAEVIQAGHDFVNSEGYDYFVQQGSEQARTLMYEEGMREAYWKNWEIITGLKVQHLISKFDYYGTTGPFSCSC